MLSHHEVRIKLEYICCSQSLAYHFEQCELQAQLDSQTANRNAEEKTSIFKVVLDKKKIKIHMLIPCKMR